ncbi:MAG: hypothetical protein AAF515_14690 [Pseudomonadota bacterium]
MKLTPVVILFVFLLLGAPGVAHAYLDPGTGSALIQGLIAALAAIGLTLKVYWHRVLGFLGLRRNADPEKTAEQIEEPAKTPSSPD